MFSKDSIVNTYKDKLIVRYGIAHDHVGLVYPYFRCTYIDDVGDKYRVICGLPKYFEIDERYINDYESAITTLIEKSNKN